MSIMPAQVIISVVLFLILFFGIGFLLNMLLKTTWFPSLLYPLVVLLLVNEATFSSFIKQPVQSFMDVLLRFGELLAVDYVILSSGLLGALLSGMTIRLLRVRGYRMF